MSKHRAALAALVACLLAVGGVLALTSGTKHPVPHGTASQSAMGSVHPPGWGATPPGFQLTPPGFQLTPPALGPTVEMFDSTDAAAVPSNPVAVAGYTAGFWPSFAAMVARFPHAVHVPIAINAGIVIRHVRMACLDIEPRDAVPSEAGAWDRAELAAGVIPCDYSDLSEMPAVKASLAAAGLHRSQYMLWLAWYRFVRGLVAGYDATQFTDAALGRNLDESTATLAFVGIKPTPPPPVCFTHRMSASQCAIRKAQIASLNGASAASWRAWHRAGCVGLLPRPVPYIGRGCARWAQEGHFFTSRAQALGARS